MSGCLTNAERRCVFEVVMHVSFLLFIVIFITSFIHHNGREDVTKRYICKDDFMFWQELCGEGERQTL